MTVSKRKPGRPAKKRRGRPAKSSPAANPRPKVAEKKTRKKNALLSIEITFEKSIPKPPSAKEGFRTLLFGKLDGMKVKDSFYIPEPPNHNYIMQLLREWADIEHVNNKSKPLPLFSCRPERDGYRYWRDA